MSDFDPPPLPEWPIAGFTPEDLRWWRALPVQTVVGEVGGLALALGFVWHWSAMIL